MHTIKIIAALAAALAMAGLMLYLKWWGFKHTIRMYRYPKQRPVNEPVQNPPTAHE